MHPTDLSATPNSLNQKTQPAGVLVPDGTRGTGDATGPDAIVLSLHARLCELVPAQDKRAGLFKVPATVDPSWLEGRMMPVLRAQRKPMEKVIASLEYDPKFRRGSPTSQLRCTPSIHSAVSARSNRRLVSHRTT